MLFATSGVMFCRSLIFTYVSFFLLFSFSGGAQISEPKKVVFQPDWFGNAQFSGFFWAELAGIYEAYGLDVSFERFDYGVDFLNEVKSGKAAFGTAEAYILMDAVARGEPLVAIGAVLSESPAGYIYLKDSGITKAADLEGKVVGVHNYAEALLPFFVGKAGLDADSVSPLVVKHNIEILLDGKVDLHQGYAIDEMLRLQAMTEKEVDILLFEDLGLPMYSMVLYTSSEFLESNKDIVDSFLAASAAGWEEAMAAPKIAALVVNGPFDDERVENEQMSSQADALVPFVVGSDRATLSMTREKWEAMQSAYLKSGMIEKPVDLDSFLYLPTE